MIADCALENPCLQAMVDHSKLMPTDSEVETHIACLGAPRLQDPSERHSSLKEERFCVEFPWAARVRLAIAL